MQEVGLDHLIIPPGLKRYRAAVNLTKNNPTNTFFEESLTCFKLGPFFILSTCQARILSLPGSDTHPPCQVYAWG